MPIVQSGGTMQGFADPGGAASHSVGGTVGLYSHAPAYASIYATQPNVRTCVDFLARNIAELALQVFRRVSDTDRVRLPKHQLVRWLSHPTPSTRRFRSQYALVADLAIYFNAYWLKVPWVEPTTGEPSLGLLRLPPAEVEVHGGLLPTEVWWTRNGRRKVYEPRQIVRFDGYNPLDPLTGLSPLETLRRILAEEQAAGEHREAYWRHASRMDGIIERPLAAPRWTPDQKREWRNQWSERFSGAAAAGATAVLEDGMTFKPTSFSPKDSEYLSSRKLTREECAAAYHIPLPFVGILEHATFSNIREQHKHLYQDTLGPWLRDIKEEIEGQLLIECDDVADVYTEFNIAQKLAGAFEEQATSLQIATGRPYMTANEARARLNLPRIQDDPSADELAAQQGGPSSNGAPAPDDVAPRRGPDDTAREADDGEEARVRPILEAARVRQRARVDKHPPSDRVSAYFASIERWNRELTDDLRPVLGDAAAQRAAAANIATLMELTGEAA